MGDCPACSEHRREAELPQLQGKVYCDHAGATLYTASQLRAVMQVTKGSPAGTACCRIHGSIASTAAGLEILKTLPSRCWGPESLLQLPCGMIWLFWHHLHMSIASVDDR